MNETFWSLFCNSAHWEFEIFLMILFDLVIGAMIWPFLKKHWQHHKDRDAAEKINWATKPGDITVDPNGQQWVCGGKCDIVANPPAWAACPEDCDHNYEYFRRERIHACKNCGQEPPIDWYYESHPDLKQNESREHPPSYYLDLIAPATVLPATIKDIAKDVAKLECENVDLRACLIAAKNTKGVFYCTRTPGHDGPCAAILEKKP